MIEPCLLLSSVYWEGTYIVLTNCVHITMLQMLLPLSVLLKCICCVHQQIMAFPSPSKFQNIADTEVQQLRRDCQILCVSITLVDYFIFNQ